MGLTPAKKVAPQKKAQAIKADKTPLTRPLSPKELLALVASNLPVLSKHHPKAAQQLLKALQAAQDDGVDIPGVKTPVLSNAQLRKLVGPELAALAMQMRMNLRHDRVDFVDGNRAREISWLTLNPVVLGKALYAERPVLLLSQRNNADVYRVDENLTVAQMKEAAAGLNAIRDAALAAEAKLQASNAARGRRINAALARKA